MERSSALLAADPARVIASASERVRRSFPAADVSVWLSAGRVPTPAIGVPEPDRFARAIVERSVRLERVVRDRHRGRIAIPIRGTAGALGALLVAAPFWGPTEALFLQELADETGTALERGLVRN